MTAENPIDHDQDSEALIVNPDEPGQCGDADQIAAPLFAGGAYYIGEGGAPVDPLYAHGGDYPDEAYEALTPYELSAELPYIREVCAYIEAHHPGDYEALEEYFKRLQARPRLFLRVAFHFQCSIPQAAQKALEFAWEMHRETTAPDCVDHGGPVGEVLHIVATASARSGRTSDGPKEDWDSLTELRELVGRWKYWGYILKNGGEIGLRRGRAREIIGQIREKLDRKKE